MIYLNSFNLLNEDQEARVYSSDGRKIYNNYYPLGIFSSKQFRNIMFDDITIFSGGNGTGKSTLLNIIAEKLNASKKSNTDKGTYFDLYVNLCNYDMLNNNPNEVKVLTSDDVFDYLLDVHSINSNVNRFKNKLGQEYLENKYNKDDNPIENYEAIKANYEAKHHTESKYIRERLVNNNIIEHSNGESALIFWEREIKEDSVYILDEPENSLSPENQLKLKKFIEESVRFYHCQFIISTHSPFLLNLYDAKIYDLDESPVITKKWNELNNVKTYYDFFKDNEEYFN